MVFHNPQPIPVRIDSVSISSSDPEVFSFDKSQFPLTVLPGESSNFTVSYTLPSDSFSYSPSGMLTLYLSGSDSDGIACPNPSFYLQAHYYRDFSDSGNVLLFPLDSSIVNISSDIDSYAPTNFLIHLLNNSDTAIRLLDLQVKGGDSDDFRVLHWDTKDSVIPSGKSVPVYMKFQRITGVWQPRSQIFVQLADSSYLDPVRLNGFFFFRGVKATTYNTSISINPNPATSSFSLDLVNFWSSNVHLTDPLGRQIGETFYLNGPIVAQKFDVTGFSAGIYFLTIEGIDDSGVSFNTTRKIVVTH